MEYTREELEELNNLKEEIERQKAEVEELRRQLKVFQDKEEERKEKERKRLEKKANKPRRGPGRPKNPSPPKKEYIPLGRRSIIPDYEKEMIVRMYQNNVRVEDIIKSSGYSRPTVYKILNESKAVNRYKRK